MKKNHIIPHTIRAKSLFGLCFCLVALLFAGCDLFPRKEKFDKTPEYYNAAGTGYTWDTADDVTEEEAQPFTWTLEKATLTQIHLMEMGGNIPKTYTVTKLNATTLEYHDDYGKYYTFTREP